MACGSDAEQPGTRRRRRALSTGENPRRVNREGGAPEALKPSGGCTYYRCRKRDRHGKDTCTLTPVLADQLEGALLAEVRARVMTRGVQDLVVAEVQAELAAEAAELADRLAVDPSGEGAPASTGTAALQGRAAEVNRRLADLAWVPAALGQFDALWAVYQPGERGRLVEALVTGVRVLPDHTARLTWQPWFEKATGRCR